MIPTLLSALADHLWHSTLFVAVTAVVILLLRRNRACVRYGVWLIASVKFLVPFAALAAVGRQFGWQPSASLVQPEVTLLIDAIGQPFSGPDLAAAVTPADGSSLTTTLPFVLLAIWCCGCAMHLLAWRVRWRRVAAVVRGASPLEEGRELGILRRLETRVGVRHPLAMVSSNTHLEPGVFGILKPVLVWPKSLGKRLSDRQLEAILTHELCHVRRRDNLAAAVHMLVEALFWFHPLVWWLGTRMADERERACDEQVLALGNDPRAYAESILKTCALCTESPLVCVAGVTGSDLKKRIGAIVRGDTGERMQLWKTLLLATVGGVTIAVPVVSGVLSARPVQAQTLSVSGSGATFEVASVRPNPAGVGAPLAGILPGGRFTAPNVTVRTLVRAAYGLQDYQVSGGPSWMDSDRFDVNAVTGGTVAIDEVRSMLQSLLAERFGLMVHVETRTLSVYKLVPARTDPTQSEGLRRSGSECAAVNPPTGVPMPPPPPSGTMQTIPVTPGALVLQCPSIFFPGHISVREITMPQLASRIMQLVGRPVIDETGLDGAFDVDLTYTPVGQAADAAPPNLTDAPSIFTAVQEQIGLTLRSDTNLIDVLVIDRVEPPTPD